MLIACGTTSEMRSSNITKDAEFIYADPNTSCGELWYIHEANKKFNDAVNKQLKQIRNGTKF